MSDKKPPTHLPLGSQGQLIDNQSNAEPVFKELRVGKIVLACALIVLGSSSYCMASPEDLEQFVITGNCRKCDLSKASVSVAKGIGMMNLEGSNLIESTLSSYRIAIHQYSNFINSTAKRLYIENGDFSYSQFNHAMLKKAVFNHVNLTGADFSGADLSFMHFNWCNLSHANISEEQMKSVGSFCNSTLPDGEFSDC